ncbi:MAG TPA: hypothetical protein VNL77_06380 [Roseiflexaceae bacterium]|nr:hypothetical protein [Roseiflexaceae bacterium]
MINAHVPGVAVATHAVRKIRRPGMGTFWLLFALESVLIGAALLAVLNALPARTPLTQAADVDTLRAAVWSRVDGTLEDPVIEVAPGVTARSSAVRGFALGGQTYFYYFEGRRGFDPLSRGAVSEHAIEVVARDTDGERTLVIYRMLNG